MFCGLCFYTIYHNLSFSAGIRKVRSSSILVLQACFWVSWEELFPFKNVGIFQRCSWQSAASHPTPYFYSLTSILKSWLRLHKKPKKPLKDEIFQTTYPTTIWRWLDGCSFFYMKSSAPHIFLYKWPWSLLISFTKAILFIHVQYRWQISSGQHIHLQPERSGGQK